MSGVQYPKFTFQEKFLIFQLSASCFETFKKSNSQYMAQIGFRSCSMFFKKMEQSFLRPGISNFDRSGIINIANKESSISISLIFEQIMKSALDLCSQRHFKNLQLILAGHSIGRLCINLSPFFSKKPLGPN